jgi:endonuclease/exonuclease/phosphatase family metal-dependent hydrolase
MRFASYNVENLFDRPRVMNLSSWDAGRAALGAFSELIQLLSKIAYSADDKERMVELMMDLGLEKKDQGEYVLLRSNRGDLLRRPTAGGLEISANGRADWTGSLELIEEPIQEESMRNTARVINDVGADIMAVVEAESRPVLNLFSDTVLPSVNAENGGNGRPFDQVMVIDGNDSRGIDVGLMTRGGNVIDCIRSHIDDRDSNGERIFSRDCPEFTVTTDQGNQLLVLVNHFKSKGYGEPATSDRRRRKQAERVSAIYRQRRAEGEKHVIIAGDLNDYPGRATLSALLDDTDLVDVSTLNHFDNGGYVGTYGNCKRIETKFDYILMSPEVAAVAQASGVFRKGMWPGKRPPLWEAYPTLTNATLAASDHAALWVDLDL